MPNYKHQRDTMIWSPQITARNIPEDSDLKVLYYDFAGGSAVKSMLDLETNSAYKTGASKYFYMVSVQYQHTPTAGASIAISYSASVDTAGTIKFIIPSFSAGLTQTTWSIPQTHGVTTYRAGNGRYIAVNPSTTNCDNVVICGFELDRIL